VVALLFAEASGSLPLEPVQDAAERHGALAVVPRAGGLLLVLPSASGAVACAREFLGGIHRQAEGPAVKLGIHFGEVIDEGWRGPAVDTAVGLAAVAEPGAVLVSNSIRHLLDTSRTGQAFELVGTLDVSGSGQTAPVWAVITDAVAPGAGLPPLVASARGLPFRGREVQMATLWAAWDRVSAGGPRLALVSGEPGVGKTRLAVEFARRLHDLGAPVLAGHCDHEPLGSYQPIRVALGHFVRTSGPAAVTAMLSERAPLLARLVPELGPAPARPPGDPDMQRVALFDAVVAVLAHAGRHQPALLILDDLHWADEPTVVLLRHILRTMPPGRLMVLATVRPHEIDRRHPMVDALSTLGGGDIVDRIDLDGLGLDAVEKVVAGRVGHELDEPLRALAADLHRITDGNPFFLAQLLGHLIEVGRLREVGERWEVDGDAGGFDIPRQVRDVVARRLTGLSPDCQTLLRAASVLGMDFDLDVVSLVADVVPDIGLDLLEDAMRWRVVAEVPDTHDRFSFVHALVRQTLYEGMSMTRRHRLHQRAAAAIRTAGGDTAAVATHLLAATAAAPADEICQTVLAAAREAMERTGYEAALELSTRALAALDNRLSDQDRLALLAVRAEARVATGSPGAALGDVLAAGALAERTGDHDTLANVLTHWCRTATIISDNPQLIRLCERCLDALPAADDVRRARLLAALCHQLVYTEPLDRVQQRALQAYDMARRLGDPVSVGYAATAYRFVSDYQPLADRRHDVLAAIEETANVYDDHTARFIALRHSLPVDFERGDRPAFDAALAEYESLAAVEHIPAGVAVGLRARAALALCEGKLGEAESIGSEAFRLAPQEIVSQSALLFALYREWDRLAELAAALPLLVDQFPTVVTWPVVGLGFALELGRRDEAVEGLAKLAADGFRSLQGAPAMRAIVSILAEIAVASGEPDVVEPMHDLVAPWGGQNLAIEEYLCLGSSERWIASLEAAMGRYDDAVARYRKAIVFDEEFGSRLWAAYDRVGLARALRGRRDAGDLDEADRLLDEASLVSEETGALRLARFVADT
jgi:tetratricopeptide (TPR) repeat protein